MPTGDQLTAVVTKLDADLFDAYNSCDLVSFARYVAPNIEFYHDKGGFEPGRQKLVKSIKDNICGKLRRVLVPGTLDTGLRRSRNRCRPLLCLADRKLRCVLKVFATLEVPKWDLDAHSRVQL